MHKIVWYILLSINQLYSGDHYSVTWMHIIVLYIVIFAEIPEWLSEPLLNINNIQHCVIDIKSWMTANMLQLNMDKTEVLVLMNKSLRNPITINTSKIDSIDISTEKQCKKSWCHIWQCFKLRSFCEHHLQICLVQFIQHQQKPKFPNNRCCQDPYPSLRDVQNRLLQQPLVRHPR